MIDGQDRIGSVTMDLLDHIEREYPDEQQPKIKQVLVAVEVQYIDEEGDTSTHIMYDTSEPRPVTRAGLYHYLGQAMGLR